QFLIGLAVLGLLSEAAGRQPVACLVDDYQWLDRPSARTLGFVARRLVDSTALVFAVRVPGAELARLPQLPVTGLREADACALLESVLVGTLDSRVKELIIAETHGNPLALLELPRGRAPEQLPGGFWLPGSAPLADPIEEDFRRQLETLPGTSRRLLQVAAAEPSGDQLLVRRAAARLGIPAEAADPVTATRLVRFGARVRFRHPLARLAAYHSASPEELRRVHAALADVSDSVSDPDRLAWHRAAATREPDEDVAAELERLAARAGARGGLPAAAAFLERAALLTPDLSRRGTRAIAAAEAKHQAGAPDAAATLLATMETRPQDEPTRARLNLLRGRMAFRAGRSGESLELLLDAAGRYERIDARLARESYLEALSAALLGHRVGSTGPLQIARAARGTPPPSDRGASDLLLEGMVTLITEGYEAGTPPLRHAVSVFRHGDVSGDEQLRWLFAATRGAVDVWDDDSWRELSIRQVELARGAGALSLLPFALWQRIAMHLHAGELTTAASLVREFAAVKKATSADVPDFGAMLLAAWQGRDQDALWLIDEIVNDMNTRGRGFGVSIAHYAASVLRNGLGQYEDALASAELAVSHPEDLSFANLALAELIEAAVRSGRPERAVAAQQRLTALTQPSGTGWGAGVAARSRALLSEGDIAERLYREAIACLGSAPAGAELARAHLLYGEWLRSEDRLGEARECLQVAQVMLQEMEIGAFGDRAGRELAAASGARPARPARIPSVGDALTEQEAQIAHLARAGLSNPEIGARLFISARTVQYHLGKVFTKLGISSRSQLKLALPSRREPVPVGAVTTAS
ncbi:MAG TPA: LuxR C-terminal-related transcriptional regulator, partial [Streptosporangiaceae bacterium]|nr:LuxR C-terminal-related transcriptional regulator [Streptosporangiaceae bacterium]